MSKSRFNNGEPARPEMTKKHPYVRPQDDPAVIFARGLESLQRELPAPMRDGRHFEDGKVVGSFAPGSPS